MSREGRALLREAAR